MQLATTVASVTDVAPVTCVTLVVDVIPVAVETLATTLVAAPVAACLLTKEKSGLFLVNGSNCVSHGSDRVLATHCVSVYLIEYSYPSVQILYSLCSLALLSLNYY